MSDDGKVIPMPKKKRSKQAPLVGSAKVAKQKALGKREQIAKYRARGWNWDRIAREMDYKDRSGPFHLFRRMIEEREQDSLRELREVNVDRLEAIIDANWDLAMGSDDKPPNPVAAGVINRAIETCARMLGLNAPVKVEQTIINKDLVAQEIEEMLTEMARIEAAKAKGAKRRGASSPGTGKTPR